MVGLSWRENSFRARRTSGGLRTRFQRQPVLARRLSVFKAGAIKSSIVLGPFPGLSGKFPFSGLTIITCSPQGDNGSLDLGEIVARILAWGFGGDGAAEGPW